MLSRTEESKAALPLPQFYDNAALEAVAAHAATSAKAADWVDESFWGVSRWGSPAHLRQTRLPHAGAAPRLQGSAPRCAAPPRLTGTPPGGR